MTTNGLGGPTIYTVGIIYGGQEARFDLRSNSENNLFYISPSQGVVGRASSKFIALVTHRTIGVVVWHIIVICRY